LRSFRKYSPIVRVFLMARVGSFGTTFAIGLALVFAAVATASAQSKSEINQKQAPQSPLKELPDKVPAKYVNPLDVAISFKTVAILPSQDNLKSIYSEPLHEVLKGLVKKDHRWSEKPLEITGEVPTCRQLVNSPQTILKLASSAQVDGILCLQLIREPGGIRQELRLFFGFDGKVFAEAVSEPGPERQFVFYENLLAEQYRLLKDRVPYSGSVLSRSGNRFTIDLGARDGLKPGFQLSIIQIVDLERHPKFQFVTQAHKQIVGLVRVSKVEEKLAFADLVHENDRGIIEKGAKIDRFSLAELESVSLPAPVEGATTEDENANKEWRPLDPPTFGKLGLGLGLGSFTQNLALQTNGAISGKEKIFPSLLLAGEVWLTQNWFLAGKIRQGVLTLENPISGSTPAELNGGISQYELLGIYNWLIVSDFWGPRVQLSAGYAKHDLKVDSSTPVSLTSASYSGFLFGLKGIFPVFETWEIGAGLQLFLMNRLSESPVSNGSTSESSINRFQAFAAKSLSPRLRAFGNLDFEFYNSSYSGSGSRASDAATTQTQNIFVLTGGVEWLF